MALPPECNGVTRPHGTMSFALIFHDTDAAPGKGSMDVTHWILWNIAASAAQLPAGVQPDLLPMEFSRARTFGA